MIPCNHAGDPRPCGVMWGECSAATNAAAPSVYPENMHRCAAVDPETHRCACLCGAVIPAPATVAELAQPEIDALLSWFHKVPASEIRPAGLEVSP